MIIRISLVVLFAFLVSCKTAETGARKERPKSELQAQYYPKQKGFVNDFADIFTNEEIDFLENLLVHLKDSLNKEIVVITIDSIPQSLDFDQYALGLSVNWAVGNESRGNGLTMVFSKSLRKIRISTTDLTRNYLPDDFCKAVIDEIMIPEFRKENYYDGILLGLNELIREWI